MNEKALAALLRQVQQGEISPQDAALQLKMAPFEDLGFAKIDRHRGLRQGAAEVIYGAGKTPEQIARIAAALRDGGQETVLITRMSQEAAALRGGAAAAYLPCRGPGRCDWRGAGAGRAGDGRRRHRRHQ